MAARSLRCNIEDPHGWHPLFFAEPQIVACVAVLARYGSPPATLDVDRLNIRSAWLGDALQFRPEVSWSAETLERAERLRATVQSRSLVEMAALALAIVHHVLQLGQLDVTRYGDRADYRSTRMSCMLEVSGTEVPTELARRHRQKIAQASLNPLGWDSYVIVCAFSSVGHRIRFSFHRVKEAANEEASG